VSDSRAESTRTGTEGGMGIWVSVSVAASVDLRNVVTTFRRRIFFVSGCIYCIR